MHILCVQPALCRGGGRHLQSKSCCGVLRCSAYTAHYGQGAAFLLHRVLLALHGGGRVSGHHLPQCRAHL